MATQYRNTPAQVEGYDPDVLAIMAYHFTPEKYAECIMSLRGETSDMKQLYWGEVYGQWVEYLDDETA